MWRWRAAPDAGLVVEPSVDHGGDVAGVYCDVA